jgi:L-threonylcarbamoyladenylate synthase
MTGVSQRFSLLDPDEAALGITAAVAAIRAGDLVVMPTDTVYGVAADPFSIPAVDRLLRAKDRGREMPPPVLVGSVAVIQGLADDIDDRVDRLVEKFWPGGLSLILRAAPSLNWDLGETRNTVMLRMPDHDETLQLLRRTGPLAVTSANRHGRPPATSVEHAEAELGDRIEVYLDGGPTPGDVPSTILDLTRITPQLLRRGVVTDEMLRELIPSMEVDIDGEPMPGQELLAEWEAEQARLDAEEAAAEEERERKLAAGELVDEEEVPFEPWPEGEGPVSEPLGVDDEGSEPAQYVELAERDAEERPEDAEDQQPESAAEEPVDQVEDSAAEPEDSGDEPEPAPEIEDAAAEPAEQPEPAEAPDDVPQGEIGAKSTEAAEPVEDEPTELLEPGKSLDAEPAEPADAAETPDPTPAFVAPVVTEPEPAAIDDSDEAGNETSGSTDTARDRSRQQD